MTKHPNINDRPNINNNAQISNFLRLQQLGLIATHLTENHAADDDMPWYLHIFFGFSGVLSSLFVIGFLSVLLVDTQVFESFTATFIIGALLSAIGYLLFSNTHTRHSMFMSGLAFALSVAGQLYIAFAIMTADLTTPAAVGLFLLVQVLMTLIMPSFIYRLLSSLAAFGCTVYLLDFFGLTEISIGLLAVITTITHLQRYALLQHIGKRWRITMASMIRAVSYASAIMLLTISVYFIAAEYGQDLYNHEGFFYNRILSQGLLILASLYAVSLILKRYQIKSVSKSGMMILGATTVLGMVSLYVTGLLATTLIIIIAMANSQRVLLGLGISALVGYIFWYYYQLDTSLLIKSASMLMVAITLLLMRWQLLKRFDIQERLS